jgi:phosphoenolpyruvate carboxylase
MKRRIPATMATQHPDNAHRPFWNRGDGFVATHEEPEECLVCFRDLGAQEFMWDWEGKYADEAIIDKLFSNYHAYFKKHLLGRDKFLTFRLPNVWQEKGYSLIRSLMVILTGEDFAQDLAFRTRPLFEVILPMTEKAEQLMYIQTSFQKLARFKTAVFDHYHNDNTDYVEIIPLVEGVEDQIHIGTLLAEYVRLHRNFFRRKPLYIRPFLARSDPALLSGFVANVLANKIALSEIYAFGKKHGVAVYPIIGAGSLVFRGGLSPARCKKFVSEYGGVRTVTVQSAFRYDHPKAQVKKAIAYLNRHLPHSRASRIDREDRLALSKIIKIFSASYQSTLAGLLHDLETFFQAVPKRRERRQHIGLLAYGRRMGKSVLPRAISFAAVLYSLGIPPEFIGIGRGLGALSEREKQVLMKYYKYFKDDLVDAGKYINRENIDRLSRGNAAWRLVAEDIGLAEKYLRTRFGPKSNTELLHYNLASQLLLRRTSKAEMSRLIVETGKLRGGLG